MKVLVTDYGFADVEIERRILAGSGHTLMTAQCRTEDEVIEAAAGCDALLVQWAPVGRRSAESLKSCKVVVRYGIGYDNLDVSALKAAGIQVANVPDYCIDEVADHSVALAVSLLRQLPQTHARTLGGEWRITPPGNIPAFKQSVFATAGFGRIARAVLARAKAFGFKLAAYDPFVDAAVMKDFGVLPVDKDSLFSDSTVVSLHLPLSPETRHFVNCEAMSRMQKGAVIVNTARGGLVDTHALAEFLTDGHLGGAGLDVYENEPLEADHPIRGTVNSILTSHTAWNSLASVSELQKKAAQEVVRALAGLELKNPL